MASSRWRRFAFFDRSTLPLPDEVWTDILPSQDDNHPTKSRGRKNQHSNNPRRPGGGGGDRLFEENEQNHNDDDEYDDDDLSSVEDDISNRGDGGRGGGINSSGRALGDRVSLTCASVMFNPSIVLANHPNVSSGNNTTDESTSEATASNIPAPTSRSSMHINKLPPAAPAASSSNHPKQQSSTGGGVPPVACSGLSISTNMLSCGGIVTIPGSGNYYSQQQMLEACSAMTLSPSSSSLAFVYPPQQSSKQQNNNSNNPPSSVMMMMAKKEKDKNQDLQANMNAATARILKKFANLAQRNNPLAMQMANGGGMLVLSFLGSRDSGLVHCVDVSMRCNPPPIAPSAANKQQHHQEERKEHVGDVGNLGENGHLSLADSASFEEEELEDLDGWRGFITPFPIVMEAFVPGADTTLTGSSAKDRIIQEHMKEMSSMQTGGMKKKKSRRVVGLASIATGASSSGGNRGNSGGAVSSSMGHLFVAAITDEAESGSSVGGASGKETTVGVCIMVDPHLHLSEDVMGINHSTKHDSNMIVYRPPPTSVPPSSNQKRKTRIKPKCVDISPNHVAVGTNTGKVLIYAYHHYDPQPPGTKKPKHSPTSGMRLFMEIPPPGGDGDHSHSVATVKFALLDAKGNAVTANHKSKSTSKGVTSKLNQCLFVCYHRRKTSSSSYSNTTDKDKQQQQQPPTASDTPFAGVCCYNLTTQPTSSLRPNSPRSRADLDNREIPSGALCDYDFTSGNFMVAWNDGLYFYNPDSRAGAAPVDGNKIAMCCLPTTKLPHVMVTNTDTPDNDKNGENKEEEEQKQKMEEVVPSHGVQDKTTKMGYSLVATTDSKSGRDAVDVYDTLNKLVAFHVLLSPGHRALQVAGVTTPSTLDGRGGRSSSIVVTSGGAIVTLTERDTSDKVNLLVQKNLYSTAISMAFSDATYPLSEITALYRKHAEHLYRKNDYESSINQYIHTIGSLEPSHVIFRFLDAPKIPLLAKYLENLRLNKVSTPVHNDLLRTCYLKLNDTVAAEKIAASGDLTSKGFSVINHLAHNPVEALATVCSMEANQVAEALAIHGATLARSLPRETAGIVMSLCDGTYSPNNLADSTPSATTNNDMTTLLENNLFMENRPQVCDKYPVSLFSSAFLENSRLLRLILSHCKRNKCVLTPSLRRTHLELTLEEWNAARNGVDEEMEKIRFDEAMTILTDTHAEELGDYETLVIVQMAEFTEGEVLLYERLQMAPMLLERYAKEGGERERRQMLALCRSDPELLAEVLGYFVALAGDRIGVGSNNDDDSDDDSEGEAEEILEDIQEALEMARAQGVLPVRIARILAGEGVGQFSNDADAAAGGGQQQQQHDGSTGVPLSVALDYIGGILDESSGEISRLKAEVEEYNRSCNAMEGEIEALLSVTSQTDTEESKKPLVPPVNINQMYSKLRDYMENDNNNNSNMNSLSSQEEFWREMGQSDDRFETIARFFGKGIIQ